MIAKKLDFSIFCVTQNVREMRRGGKCGKGSYFRKFLSRLANVSASR